MSQQDKIRQALRELVNAAERHLHGEVAPVAHAIHQAKDLLDQQEAAAAQDKPTKCEFCGNSSGHAMFCPTQAGRL